jgi:hypothetical protein
MAAVTRQGLAARPGSVVRVRARTRRATARQRKTDISARVIDDLEDHPQSTAGDVAKALSANRSTTAARLSQMVKKREITKATKGYAVK